MNCKQNDLHVQRINIQILYCSGGCYRVRESRVETFWSREKECEMGISPRGVIAPPAPVLSLIVSQLQNVGLGRGSTTYTAHLRRRL